MSYQTLPGPDSYRTKAMPPSPTTTTTTTTNNNNNNNNDTITTTNNNNNTRFFPAQSVCDWNSLPHSVATAPSTEAFKALVMSVVALKSMTILTCILVSCISPFPIALSSDTLSTLYISLNRCTLIFHPLLALHISSSSTLRTLRFKLSYRSRSRSLDNGGFEQGVLFCFVLLLVCSISFSGTLPQSWMRNLPRLHEICNSDQRLKQ